MRTTKLNWFLYIIGWYKHKWERAAAMNAEDTRGKRQEVRGKGTVSLAISP